MITTELNLRLYASSLALTITLISLYFSAYPIFQPIFTLILSALIGVALWEYYQFAKAKGFHPPVPLAIFCSTLYLFALYLSTTQGISLLPYWTLLFDLILLFLYFFFYTKDSFITLAITLFGLAYLTLTLGTTLNITFEFGRAYLFYAILVTKMTDTGAYFCGKKYGKHKLAPFISPNKTWEGTMGGICAALITGIVLNVFSLNLPLLPSLLLPFLIAILAQFGDLAESILKRDAGVKDSNQLPGLGGILDMVDSLVFTLPLIYLFLRTL